MRKLALLAIAAALQPAAVAHAEWKPVDAYEAFVSRL